jgi:hypothetical protein
MHRSIALSIVAVGLLTATCVAGREHDVRLSDNAQHVRAGMTAGQAVEILGKPSWRDRCGAKFPYGWAQSCVAELGYSSAFAPLLPGYLVVQLDGRGRVISVDTITSP